MKCVLLFLTSVLLGCTQPSNTSDPGFGVPGDALTGTGTVSRSMLTFAEMIDGVNSRSPVSESAFTLPENAAPPSNTFSGHLELIGESTHGRFTLIGDRFNYGADPERMHLPEMDIEFVQNGSHLIPAQRGKRVTSHPFWDYLVGPGRVWDEISDQGYSRAAFPFALLEKNANCTHNGTMSFLFDNDGNRSTVWYQVTQETCLYFKGNFWGQLDATYHDDAVSGSDQLQADYVQERIRKMPPRALAELTVDYPGFDLNTLTSGIEDITLYGMVVSGTHYVSGCETRYGAYAFCEWMRVPSYSTAKSILAGMSLMRLTEKYGSGVPSLLIKAYVAEYESSAGDWSTVTLNNTLDMATGNYGSALLMQDENGPKMGHFFRTRTYADRIAESFSWPHQATPGTIWVYKTSDTFIVTQALHRYLQSREGADADLFDMLVRDVLEPIGVGPGAYTSLRTSDDNGQGPPLGGYGLWFIQDDVAKIVTLLNNTGGVYQGTPLLDADLLASSMQQDRSDRGLPTAGSPHVYNNGFWGHEFTTGDGYSCNFWTPFMSGYGGISVIMMPNGSTFYVFSDNGNVDWYDVVKESHDHIGRHCS